MVTGETAEAYLPGYNCGRCGVEDCESFARRMALGECHPRECPYLDETAAALIERTEFEKKPPLPKERVVTFMPCTDGSTSTTQFILGGGRVGQFDGRWLCRVLRGLEFVLPHFTGQKCSPSMGYGVLEADGTAVHIFRNGKVTARRLDPGDTGRFIIEAVQRALWFSTYAPDGRLVCDAFVEASFYLSSHSEVGKNGEKEQSLEGYPFPAYLSKPFFDVIFYLPLGENLVRTGNEAVNEGKGNKGESKVDDEGENVSFSQISKEVFSLIYHIRREGWKDRRTGWQLGDVVETLSLIAREYREWFLSRFSNISSISSSVPPDAPIKKAREEERGKEKKSPEVLREALLNTSLLAAVTAPSLRHAVSVLPLFALGHRLLKTWETQKKPLFLEDDDRERHTISWEYAFKLLSGWVFPSLDSILDREDNEEENRTQAERNGDMPPRPLEGSPPWVWCLYTTSFFLFRAASCFSECGRRSDTGLG